MLAAAAGAIEVDSVVVVVVDDTMEPSAALLGGGRRLVAGGLLPLSSLLSSSLQSEKEEEEEEDEESTKMMPRLREGDGPLNVVSRYSSRRSLQSVFLRLEVMLSAAWIAWCSFLSELEREGDCCSKEELAGPFFCCCQILDEVMSG